LYIFILTINFKDDDQDEGEDNNQDEGEDNEQAGKNNNNKNGRDKRRSDRVARKG
jgi:hypothetical protein